MDGCPSLIKHELFCFEFFLTRRRALEFLLGGWRTALGTWDRRFGFTGLQSAGLTARELETEEPVQGLHIFLIVDIEGRFGREPEGAAGAEIARHNIFEACEPGEGRETRAEEFFGGGQDPEIPVRLAANELDIQIVAGVEQGLRGIGVRNRSYSKQRARVAEHGRRRNRLFLARYTRPASLFVRGARGWDRGAGARAQVAGYVDCGLDD